MEANKISIERELKSKSANIIWSLMSTPEGLAKWFADDVKFSGDVFTFTWGNDWSHHGMDKSDITGDYILMITDFAPDGDTDTLEDIWDANMEMLHRSTGL